MTLLGTAADEGGQFLDNQMKAGQPVLKTVGDISDTIGSSDFVQGVAGGAGTVAKDAPGLAQNTAQMLSSMSCLLICPHSPPGEQRRACQRNHCKPWD